MIFSFETSVGVTEGNKNYQGCLARPNGINGLRSPVVPVARKGNEEKMRLNEETER